MIDCIDDIMEIASPPPNLVPVPFDNGLIYVTPDYYMDKGIRMPLDALEAEALAQERNMILPSVPMVTAIYDAADIKLYPQPLNPDNTKDPNFYVNGIVNPKWFVFHNELIEAQIIKADPAFEGKLFAGHKKDVIYGRPKGKVAIFGWHRPDGRPIQNPSSVHKETYKDYSHGVRLVFPMIWKDNKWTKLQK